MKIDKEKVINILKTWKIKRMETKTYQYIYKKDEDQIDKWYIENNWKKILNCSWRDRRMGDAKKTIIEMSDDNDNWRW